MPSAAGSPATRGWLDPEKGFHEDVPLRKRQLALALRALCRLLSRQGSDAPGSSSPTQAEAAERLGCTADSLSRYLNSPRVPPERFVEDLLREASADAAMSGQDVGVTRDELLALRASAEGERRGCKLCIELGERLDSLTQQVNAPCSTCAGRQRELDARAAQLTALRGEVATLRAAVLELETVEAGLQARLAMAKASRTPLPVHRHRRDRQRSTKEVIAARQLAAQAEALDTAGKQDSALTLLRQGAVEVLSPAETAFVIVELRQHKRDHLADNLIHVYGRDQTDRHVLAVALVLHDEGAVEDAGAVLHAALR
ncbi:helix-turn-helix domain-containing protein [Streptomyces sp. NPDC002776]